MTSGDGFRLADRRVLPVLVFAMFLVLIGLVWFRAPAVHAKTMTEEVEASTVLVSADWVADRLSDPGTVVLHVASERPSRLIPGAVFLPYGEIVDEMGAAFMVELWPAERLAHVFGEHGVSSDSRVILYAEGAPHTSARAFVTLDWLGHGALTSVLDGGLEAWVASGRPTVDRPAEPRPAVFLAQPRDQMLVDADWIRDRLDDPEVTLIDARPVDEYTGAQTQHGLRGGHIPGATNIYFMDLVHSRQDPRLIDIKEVRSRFERAGAGNGPVVSYCMVGMRASYTYLVARHLGYDARFYDESWNEWGARNDLPVVSGTSRR